MYCKTPKLDKDADAPNPQHMGEFPPNPNIRGYFPYNMQISTKTYRCTGNTTNEWGVTHTGRHPSYWGGIQHTKEVSNV